MASSQTKDGFEFSCDACGEVFTPPRLGRGSAPRDFQDSLADAKAAGWRAVKVGDCWEHRCNSCA